MLWSCSEEYFEHPSAAFPPLLTRPLLSDLLAIAFVNAASSIELVVDVKIRLDSIHPPFLLLSVVVRDPG